MSSNDLASRFDLAMQTLQAGPENAAISAFTQLTRDWPNCKEAWYILGDLQMRQGDWHEATRCFEEVLKQDPEVQEVYFQLGLLSLWQGLNALAEAYWQQALRINPDYAEPRYHLALLCLRQQRQTEADAALQELIQKQPEIKAQLWLAAQEQSRLGQIHESLGLCRALQDQPETPEPQRSLLSIQGLQRSGQDAAAWEQIAALPEVWHGLLKQIYLPLHPQAEDLENLAETLQHLCATPNPLSGEALAWLPVFSSWELLPQDLLQRFQRWLTGPLQKTSAHPQQTRQRLIWVIDAPALNWQRLYFQHLAALPPARWELQILTSLPCLQTQLHRQPLQKLRISDLSHLAETPQSARQQLHSLAADVILFSGPDQDPLQFWLAHQALAPLQMSWSARQNPDTFGSGTLARDGSAPLWLRPEQTADYSAENPILLPISGSMHPDTLVWLHKLAAHHPLRLCCLPQDLLNARQLQSKLPDSSVAIWQDLPELLQLVRYSAALILPDASGQLYARLAQSLACPILRSPYSSASPDTSLEPRPESLTALLHQQRPHILTDLPETRWAVELQAQLNHHQKALTHDTR